MEVTFTCQKVRYSSKEFADADIERIKNISDRKKIPLRSYLCKCGAWHLTSKIDISEIFKENETLKERIRELEKISVNFSSPDSLVQSLQQQVKNKDQIIKNLRKTNRELVIKTLVKI